MSEVNIYKENELPESLKWQILSFIRAIWPEGFYNENEYRDWIHGKDQHAVHFVIEKNKLLISYAGVVWKELEHAGGKYKTYGLSGVFTYPSFRGKGYGLKVIKEAKLYMEKQDGDIALFPSQTTGFYEKAGFIRIAGAKILEGDPKLPKEHEEKNIYMLFISEKGKSHKNDFARKPIYFGRDVW